MEIQPTKKYWWFMIIFIDMIALGICVWLLVYPKLQQQQQLTQKLNQLQQQYQISKKAKQQLNHLPKNQPNITLDSSHILEKLMQLLNAEKLTIINIHPQKNKSGYKLALRGSYFNFKNFMQMLAHMNYGLFVNQFTISKQTLGLQISMEIKHAD